jgi:tetratricopeptide (TPR) repeat protein
MNRPLGVATWEGFLALGLCLIGDYEEARRLAARSVTYFREHDSRVLLASSVENLALALTGLGRYREARQHFLEALRLELELRIILGFLSSGAGMARVIAAEGKPEQALELFGLVLNHPATDLITEELARSLLANLEAELPPEVVAAGLERGESLDLETVIKELLEEST